MKAALAAEGWKEDRRLPKGWRIKVPLPSCGVGGKAITFLNDEADELNAAEALEYLTWQNQSEEDILVFKTILAAAENKIQRKKKKAANSKEKPNVEKFHEKEIIAEISKECVGEKETKVMDLENDEKYPGVVAMEILNEGPKASGENELKKESEEEKVEEGAEEEKKCPLVGSGNLPGLG